MKTGHIALLLLLLPVLAFGQDFRATLTGRVLDPSGGLIANCSVQVKNVDTNTALSVKTDSAGSYTVPFLAPGNYSISFEAAGFKKVTREKITLSIGQTAGIDVTLPVGSSEDSVTVTAEMPLLDAQNADRGSIIDAAEVREMPLNGRNPFMLSVLSPGVTFNGAAIYSRPFDATNGFTINGGLNGQNEFLLDGAPNNSMAGTNQIGMVPSVDAVQEFRIQTNSYDAQYGKTSGGIVNVALKSGTNDWHGSAYEFARRTGWDANTFTNKAQGKPRSEHLLDQYGGALGGPVRIPKLYNGKDKTFFFFSFEKYRESTPETTYRSVPAPEFINGDFSNLKDKNGVLIPIYDPLTTYCSAYKGSTCTTWSRNPFPGNIIPKERLNPVAQKILSYSPKPNVNNPTASFYSQNNFLWVGSDSDAYRTITAKIDQNIGNNQRLSFSASNNHRMEHRNLNGVVSGPGEEAADPLERMNHSYVLDWVDTLNPTTILNIRTSWNRGVEAWRAQGNFGYDITQLGFPASLRDSIPGPQLFGRYEFSSYVPLGRTYYNNGSNTFAIHPNLAKVYRTHTVKVGLDFREIVYNQKSPSGNTFQMTFSPTWTQQSYITADGKSGNALASFLLGYPASATVQPQYFPSTVQRYYAPYIQDDWKVTRKLTINLGLRWDFNFAPFERHDRINRGFDPNAVNPVDGMINRTAFPGFPTIKGGLLFAAENGSPRTVANLDKTALQPRFGFAYQLTQKMVWRGGYGRYYLNPNNDYLQYIGFTNATSAITSVDNGKTPVVQADGHTGILANPLPNGVTPIPGSSQGLMTYLGKSFNFFNPNFKVPYVEQFSFGFQYEMPMRSTLEISYIGNRGHKLQSSKAYNEPDLAMRRQCNLLEGGSPAYCNATVPNPFYGLAAFAGTTLGSNQTMKRWDLARPFPEFGTITEYGRNDGKTWYNGLQVTETMRSRKGLNLTVAYTWSKEIQQNGFKDTQQEIMQRSVYQYDQTHVFRTGTIWELPIGNGKKFFNTSHPVWSRLASGWQHTMMFFYSSGTPTPLPSNVIYQKKANVNVDWSAAKIQGWQPCIARINDTGTITRVNTSAFDAANNCGSDLSQYNFLITPSYATRYTDNYDDSLRMHHVAYADMSLNKVTKVTERTSIQFRAEAFNVFNTFRFPQQTFNTSPTDVNFGSIIKSNVAQSSAGYPRQIQLAVKFIF